jgi:hypothetical protein
VVFYLGRHKTDLDTALVAFATNYQQVGPASKLFVCHRLEKFSDRIDGND